eukprot:7937879-Heterocapsa_arctica.AAC.1
MDPRSSCSTSQTVEALRHHKHQNNSSQTNYQKPKLRQDFPPPARLSLPGSCKRARFAGKASRRVRATDVTTNNTPLARSCLPTKRASQNYEGKIGDAAHRPHVIRSFVTATSKGAGLSFFVKTSPF